MKFKKKWEVSRGGGGGRVTGGCEQRIEVFVKIQKQFFFFGGGTGDWVEGGGWGGGDQGRCNREVKFL